MFHHKIQKYLLSHDVYPVFEIAEHILYNNL